MRRLPSQLEITRLLAQLQADDIAPGWLRPFLWRCGWMMPPPSFMRVSTDGAARAALVVMALFTVGLSMSFWLFLLICAVAWLLAVRRIDWRQIDMVRLLSIAAGFIGMSAFLYWWRPRGWPDLSSLPQNVMFSLPLALYFALVQMHEHADRYDDRRLPRWADYVARVLATEAF